MKQPLNEQFRRMQKLAGILNENEDWNEIAMNNHEQALKKELGNEYEKASINMGWGVDENAFTISSKIYNKDSTPGNLWWMKKKSNQIFKTIHDETGDIIDQKLEDYN
jgi:hypothetical protein